MIVSMKKVSVIVQAKDTDSTMQRLRSLGALHIEHQQPPQGKDISGLKDDITLIDEVVGILSEEKFSQGIKSAPGKELEDWKFRVKHIIDLNKRLEQLEEYSHVLINRISQWEEWGDFDPDSIRALEEKQVYVRLYQVPVKELNHFPSQIVVKNLFTSAGIAHCVVIAREKTELPFKELPLPKMGLEKTRTRLYEDRRIMELITEEILQSAGYLPGLLEIKKSLEKELEFHEALRGMGQAGNIMYLSGYVPYDAVENLQGVSRREKWGISVNDPSDEDRVPTLMRNPHWVTLINPVFKFIEIVPGYREFDISLWFLIFLSFFFGVIIGDAGYGTIYFALTLFAHRKFGHRIKDKTVIYLFYVFSLCAITWGLLSGTILGTAWLKGRFNPLVPALADDKFVRRLFFLVGATHLSIAHIWRIIVQFPSFVALTEVGWICILWSAFFLTRSLLLGDGLPSWIMILIMVGCALVVFYSNPRKNIVNRILAGLGTLVLNLMNNFTDVVSYIRLFAVGLAGVAVANAFNTMASSVAGMGIFSVILGGLILIAGHGLNIIILGPMSVLVHGVRLNVLEFCMHLDVKWNGFAYNPLREQNL